MISFTDAQIATALTKAPGPIQKAVEFGVTINVAATIGENRSLSIEQITQLSRLLEATLSGLINPTQLQSEVAELLKSPQKGGEVMGDLSRALFKPLQDYVKNPEREIIPDDFTDLLLMSPTPTPPTAPTSLPAPDHTLPAPPVSAINKIMPVPKPPAPAPVTPKPVSPPQPAPRPASPPTQVEPSFRTMAMDVEGTDENKSPAPKPVPPPPSKPPAPKPEEVHADLKKYGIDPYREPVE